MKVEKFFNWLIVVFFIVSVSLSKDNESLNIAVLSLDEHGISKSEVSILTDRLRLELFNTKRFNVMERAKMEEILQEQGFQQSGCVSNECIVEAGKLLGIKLMISGSIGRIGSIYTINLRIINVESAEIEVMHNEDTQASIEELLTIHMKKMAIVLSDKIGTEYRRETYENFGQIYVYTNPLGASINIDNTIIQGITPILLDNITKGRHKIKVKKGKFFGEEFFECKPNEITNIKIDLKEFLHLNIHSRPNKADIYLNNELVGKTPILEYPFILEKYYTIKIVKETYTHWIKKIQIKHYTKDFKAELQSVESFLKMLKGDD